MKNPQGRKHSKFSASGAERWLNCSASVALSEGMPDQENEWSKEGTKAHELLEQIMRAALVMKASRVMNPKCDKSTPKEMIAHATNAANFMLKMRSELDADLMVETRIYLDFIHPEMFGTYDGAVLDYFGTLHIFDFKYGVHPVSPKENMQMIFYALGTAHKYDWNFERARLWIIQPRVRGYDGPTYWDISIEQLRKYEEDFKEGVWNVENDPTFDEGPWCYFCKAKSKCPLKKELKRARLRAAFA